MTRATLRLRDQPLQYVGAWDSEAKCDCVGCNNTWARMRRTAERNNLP